MPEFTIGDTDFLLDGRPFRILSGALHYFRVHPDLWADRIDKARRMGLNTIETYVAWNAHAPEPGTFDVSGGLDLDRFLRLVADAGMYAIVRPGPYICAEWDNGGLPAWLFRDPAVGVRRFEPRYLAAVREYLTRVFEVVVPHQIDRGGPVLLVQVENEYGAFGSDKRYLQALADYTREAGVTVPLTTVDQPDMLEAGGLDGLHRTASFGSDATARLALLREHQPTGPLMCSEFWNGWFDNWGAHHHTTSAADAAAELDALLAAGASVNLYMFHGGTNFGLTSGANDKGVYQPIVTSYDYDAPLDEGGDPTPKYHAFREVIARYHKVPDTVPPPARSAPTPSAVLGGPVPLLDAPERWGTWRSFEELPVFDELSPMPRLALLRTWVDGPGVLVFGEVRDRATVFLDGVRVGTLLREHHERALPLPAGPGELLVLVEDEGRVDYGPRIGEPKGIIGGASVDGSPLLGWEVLPIDLAALPSARPSPVAGPVAGPVLLRASVDVPAPADLFLDTGEWGKGMAWFNGFPLGRYWRRGPQRTLYVPRPVVREGANELTVLELDTLLDPAARFVPRPLLGHTEA
ncbi:beta-galactosidase family protein [Amycolatopsis sp., V23-08]|uniref:Beta-galactosidase family protein n=1 Tax=Amycolatopsis heterodermiae TaxID=3110235 RepID=A0ABU5RGA0_9PSEU|nr:beta-galactosidase family protein [Amycolatopsis sp., V23-08]MEA5365311.1 beta-galactosidase family protein [Amycolatopsis sp., V23-08]